MIASPKRLFCFGLGYTAQFLIDTLRAENSGWTFAGTTRDLAKSRDLRQQGITTFLFDDTTSLVDPRYALDGVTHILVSTPPEIRNDPVLAHHSDDLAGMKGLKWLAYLSTTGVYGNRDGDWVSETSDLNPTSIRGTRRMRAEEEWQSLAHQAGLPLHIFRLAGIYGPGRSALDSVRAGIARRLLKPNHVFNRIHVADIIGILLRSMDAPHPGAIYNVSDDEPCASHEVIAYACQLLDVLAPPLISVDEANLAPITRSFYSDNKRVRNDKVKADLNYTFQFPDFRNGLKGCQKWERTHPDTPPPSGSAESVG
ncbi:MAG: SDR family oxidoreductase [Pseudomonadota bacterium]